MRLATQIAVDYLLRRCGVAVQLALCTAQLASGQDRLLLDPARAVTQYRQRTWTTEQGLPMDRINALAQTADGYLWLGTQEGLVRFDGLGFEHLSKQNSALGANFIVALHVDRTGALWVGTRG